jgi:hypothetical protein
MREGRSEKAVLVLFRSRERFGEEESCGESLCLIRGRDSCRRSLLVKSKGCRELVCIKTYCINSSSRLAELQSLPLGSCLKISTSVAKTSPFL